MQVLQRLFTSNACNYVFDLWSSFSLIILPRLVANLFSIECLCYITSSPANQAVIDQKIRMLRFGGQVVLNQIATVASSVGVFPIQKRMYDLYRPSDHSY